MCSLLRRPRNSILFIILRCFSNALLSRREVSSLFTNSLTGLGIELMLPKSGMKSLTSEWDGTYSKVRIIVGMSEYGIDYFQCQKYPFINMKLLQFASKLCVDFVLQKQQFYVFVNKRYTIEFGRTVVGNGDPIPMYNSTYKLQRFTCH